MDYLLVTGVQLLTTIGNLALVSLGLAIIFGMMRVINLAHGEFIMLGGFVAVFATRAGVNIWISMLVVAPLVVGLLGLLIERLVIRHLYGRMIDTMLATWGLSLLLVGCASTFFGNRVVGIAAPTGGLRIGGYTVSSYDIILTLIACVLYAGCAVFLARTRAGLKARATMQNREMAASLGIEPARVYAVTFTVGAALSGMAGALLAPISGVLPTMGAAYVAKAFITVITGGASPILGSALSSVLLGAINAMMNILASPVVGDIALLLAATIFLRLLPTGITGRFFRGKA